METKICSKCKKELPATKEYFVVEKRSKTGLGASCRECKRKLNKESAKKCRNSPARKASKKRWIENNRERIRASKRQFHKRHVDSDPKYLATNRLRSRLKNAFIRFSQNGKTRCSREYGIDYEAIFRHIGPCPGPRNEWQIDHIIPLSSFDFNDPEQVKLAFAPENHQWLPKIDNLIKGNKLPPIE